MMYNFSVVPGVYSASNRIVVIRDLRAAIGMSLQETSDLVDELTKGRERVFDIDGVLGMGIVDQLHRNGIRVDELPEKDTSAPKESRFKNDLKSLLVFAVEEGKYDEAALLLNMLRAQS